MNVFVREEKLFGDYMYIVYVDGEVLHKMFLYRRPPLTHSEQLDMARLYQEALEYWDAG